MAASKALILLYISAQFAETFGGESCLYGGSNGNLYTIYCYGGCCGTTIHKYCCKYTNVATIVGGVIGTVVLIAIIVSIVTCCCCACCPGHRYRTRGYVVATQPLIPGSGTSYAATTTTTTGSYTTQPGGHYPGTSPPYQIVA